MFEHATFTLLQNQIEFCLPLLKFCIHSTYSWTWFHLNTFFIQSQSPELTKLSSTCQILEKSDYYLQNCCCFWGISDWLSLFSWMVFWKKRMWMNMIWRALMQGSYFLINCHQVYSFFQCSSLLSWPNELALLVCFLWI